MDLSWDYSCDKTAELISGVAPLMDYTDDSLEKSPSESQQHELELQNGHAMNPESETTGSSPTASVRRKINSSSAKNRDTQNLSRDEGNGGYSPIVTNRYAVLSNSQMQSPGVAFSPLGTTHAPAQAPRRIGGGIRVQLFRDPDPEGEERSADQDLSNAGQNSGQIGEQNLEAAVMNTSESHQVQNSEPTEHPFTAADSQLQPMRQLQQEQLAIQETLQLQLQQQLHDRHNKLQQQMEQLQLQQHQLQQEEEILHQQQHLQHQLQIQLQDGNPPSGQSSQNHSQNHADSNLPESDGTLEKQDSDTEAVSSHVPNDLDQAHKPVTSSENVVTATATVIATSRSMSRDSRSITSGENGDGAEDDSSQDYTRQSLDNDDNSLELSRSRHSSREMDGSQSRDHLNIQEYPADHQLHQENGPRANAAGSELTDSDVEQLQLDMSSIHNSESEQELMDLRSPDMQPLHPDGTDQSLAEEDEENQSEDAEADQFKLEPEADQSEIFIPEHDGTGSGSGSRGSRQGHAGLVDPLQHLAIGGAAWNQQIAPQGDFLGDDSQPEGERGPVQADGEEEEEGENGFRPVFPPNHLMGLDPVPLHNVNNLDLRGYPHAAGMDREVVGMERGGDGAVAVAQVPLPQQQQQGSRSYVSRIPAPVLNSNLALGNPGAPDNQSSGARRKTTIGAASKEKKSAKKTPPEARKMVKQSSFPRMGAKAAGSGRTQGPGMKSKPPLSSAARPRTNHNTEAPYQQQIPKEQSLEESPPSYPDYRTGAGGIEGSSFLSTASRATMPKHMSRQGVEISPIKSYGSAPPRYMHSPGASSARQLLQQMQSSNASNSPGSKQKYSSVQSRDIQNMEQVRDHLHNILQMSTNELPERSLYDQDAEGTGLLGNIGRSPEEDDVSYPMMSGRALSDVAPNFDSLLSFSKYLSGGATSQPASMHPRPDNSSLMAENQILKENIEQEKYRRKHCEKQIQQLQNKMLELQQQLAVAVSTDRKKDLVIEQLDKTLAKIVEDWKRRESQKQELVQQLRAENEEMKTKHGQQQEMLEKFEQELQKVVEQLADEQQRALQVEDERNAQFAQQEENRKQLQQLLEIERERSHTLEIERSQLQEYKERTSKELQELKRTYADETENWEEREREYLQQVEDMTNNHQALSQELNAMYQKQEQTLQETQHALSTTKKTLQECQIELDSAIREKESLKVQMGLLEAKEESSRRKLEADLNAEMEKQIRERLDEAREHYTQNEDQLRERHRGQMMELTQQHGAEIEQHHQQSHAQLQATQREHQRQCDDMQERINILEGELEKSKSVNKKLESQRVDVTSKLQSMMQSHCNEALRLLQLGSHVLSLSPAKPQSSSGSMGLSNTSQSLGNSTMTFAPTVATTTNVTFANSLLEASLLSTLQNGHGQQRVPVSEATTRSLPEPLKGEDPANTQLKTVENSSTGRERHPQSTTLFSDLNTEYFQNLSRFSHHEEEPASLDMDLLRRVSNGSDQLHSPEGARRDMTSLPAQNFFSLSDAHMMPPGEQRGGSVALPGEHLMQQPQNNVYDASLPQNILLHHGQVYDGGVHSQNSSLQSYSSASDRGHAAGQGHSQSQPDGQRSRTRPVHNGGNSSFESDRSGAVPKHQTAQGSFLSSLLQQTGGPMDDGNFGQSQEPQRLNELDYSHISDKFDQHEERQRELQKYIKMLLQRAPGAPGDSDLSFAPHAAQHEEPVLEKKPKTSSPRIVVFSPVKSQATPPHVKKSPKGVSKARGIMRHKAFSKDTIPHTSGDGSVSESFVAKSHQSPKQSKGLKGVGGLSPQQVGEISRLLGLYRNGTDSSDQEDKPPVQELYSYLQNLEETNEQIHPTKDKTSTPPRGQRLDESSRPAPKSRAKRNLEATYDVQTQQHQSHKHVIKVPTADTHHHPQGHKGAAAPHSQMPPPPPPGQGPKASSGAKKPDRKVALPAKPCGKSSRAWK